MKKVFLILAIIFLVFFQTLIWDFNFLLVLVLVVTLGVSGNLALSLAFFAGLFLDFFGGMRLGFSSLGFLLPTFLLILYRQRFSFQNPILVFLMTGFYYSLFLLITGRSLNFVEAGAILFLVMIFRFLFPFLFAGEEEKKGRLRL